MLQQAKQRIENADYGIDEYRGAQNRFKHNGNHLGS